MDIKKIEKYFNMMKDTDIKELNINKNGTKIYLRKANSAVLEQDLVQEEIENVLHCEDKEEALNEYIIKSKIVGTFHRSDFKTEKHLIEVGMQVTVGQCLGVVEAMKIVNEVDSDVDGKVSKILKRDGEHVEYGESLFIIER